MNETDVTISRWDEPVPPVRQHLGSLMTAEGLDYYQWSNGPGDIYGAHHHDYHKVIYVVRGSITFGLPESGRQATLNAGDRLDLPAGVVHNARVGPDGVACLEGHRPAI